MKTPILDDRLMSVARQIGQDAVFADVGTDHAYLPIFLLSEGKIKRAVCTDIAKGPLAKAKVNAERAGVADRCEFLLTDGLSGVENFPVTDVAVCGMGGEMIAEILKNASPKLRKGVNYILQPMTKQDTLREALAAMGFFIDAETYSSDGGKCYLTIKAHFDGVKREISRTEAFFGLKQENPSQNPAYMGYLSGKRRALQTAIAGKKDGNMDTAEEETLLRTLFEMINGKGEENDG